MNTVTISDQIIEDMARRIAAKIKIIDSDYISRKETLKELEIYCKANCKYSEQVRDVMCSSCMLADAMEIVESIGELNKQEE